jgi:TP901 family phage tail tape measure protein
MAGKDVGTGYVPIKPDTEGFGTELERGLEKEGVPAASRGAKKMQQAMAGVFAAGAALLAKSVFDAAGFERQMNEVFTLLPGISGEAMGEMTEQVKSFSTEFGIIPQEVVPALYSSLSAGVPADNVFAFMETATKLAKGGVTDLETAVDGLTSVVNAYGADVLPAQEASDLLFTTVKLGKTTVAELSSAIFQVTPTAAALGVEFGNVTAALAAMTLQGVPTSVATTQLRQLFVELSKSGSGTAKVFEEISGKTFKDFIASGGDLQGALQLLETHATDAGLGINDLFGSVEAGSAALALTGGGTEAFTNALEGMENSAGATDAAFDQMNQGLAATLDKLKAKFSVILIDIGTAIAPTVGMLGENLGLLLEMFSALPGPMQAVVVIGGTILAGLVAFAGPLLKAVQLFKMLGGAMTLLAANPWVLVVGGLILAAVLIVKNWEKVKEFFEGFVMFFKALWTGFSEDEGTGPERWALRIREIFFEVFNGIRDFFVAYWPYLLGIFTGGLGLIVGLVIQNWDAIWSKIQEVTGAIVGAVSAAFNTVWGIVSSIGGQVVGFITGIPNAIAGAFVTLAETIAAPFRAAFAAIKVAWNSTVGGFGFSVPGWIPGFGGKDFRVPTMATGGVLTGPQLVLAGEYPGAARDPEVVAPQSIIRETLMQALGTSSAGAAGAPISVHLTMVVDAGVTDPAFFERQATEMVRVVQRELDRERRAAGRSPGGVAA